MTFKKDHPLFKNYRGTLSKVYNVRGNEAIAKWSVSYIKNMTFKELLQIAAEEDLEDHMLFKLSFAEALLRKGHAKNWNLGIKKDRFVLDIFDQKDKYTTIEFTI